MAGHGREDRERRRPPSFSGNPFVSGGGSSGGGFSGNPFVGSGSPLSIIGGNVPQDQNNQNQNQNNQNQNNQNQNNQQDGGDTTTDDKTNIFTDPKTGKSGVDTLISNITGLGTDQGFRLPQLGFSGILQSLNANNKFFDRLIDGNVDAKDRVTLVGLLKANADNPRVFDQALEQYADRNNLSPDQRIALTDSFKSEVAGLERREEDFEKLVEQYESGRPKGFKEGVLGLTGQFDREFGITREELMNELGPDGEAYLKATNPQLYYSFTSPQTSQGIEELAGQAMSTGKTAEDRRYNARIMEARALAADKQSRQDANMAGSSPAFAPPTQPGTPPTQPPGTQPPPTPPGATPVPSTPSRTPTPFDYSQFPQFNMSNYAQQGLGATPQFGDFNETLNRFFRFQ